MSPASERSAWGGSLYRGGMTRYMSCLIRVLSALNWLTHCATSEMAACTLSGTSSSPEKHMVSSDFG